MIFIYYYVKLFLSRIEEWLLFLRTSTVVMLVKNRMMMMMKKEKYSRHYLPRLLLLASHLVC